MIFRFGAFELDLEAVELRHAERGRIPLERQVFEVLCLLVRNGSRVTSREEIVDTVWHGAPISDATIASRVRSLRAALGDDGRQQIAVQTLRGKGYRFGLPVSAHRATEDSLDPAPGASAPSIAVLPFQALGRNQRSVLWAPALAHELIVSLSLMKWIRVIARATSFQLADLTETTQTLDVDYVLTGSIEIDDCHVRVSPILSSARSGDVVWAERYHGHVDDLFTLKTDVSNAIAAATDRAVPQHQVAISQHREIDSLDAWSCFHLGLNHIYRFTPEDNERASRYFNEALHRAPGFARAHAGLSFVAFQRAFTSFDRDRSQAIVKAFSAAEKAMELAPDDPFSNFVLGRCYWIQQDLDSAEHFLEQATRLNPSYAQGHYSLGLVQALNGACDHIDARSDLALDLSPLDPLRYGMLGMRAWVRMNRGEWRDAAGWAVRSARTPGAHHLMDMMAALTNEVCGNAVEAGTFAARARAQRPDVTRQQFFAGLPVKAGSTRRTVSASLCRLGF